eukprot:284814861_5
MRYVRGNGAAASLSRWDIGSQVRHVSEPGKKVMHNSVNYSSRRKRRDIEPAATGVSSPYLNSYGCCAEVASCISLSQGLAEVRHGRSTKRYQLRNWQHGYAESKIA